MFIKINKDIQIKKNYFSSNHWFIMMMIALSSELLYLEGKTELFSLNFHEKLNQIMSMC